MDKRRLCDEIGENERSVLYVGKVFFFFPFVEMRVVWRGNERLADWCTHSTLKEA